jgi:N-methylhydantoinase A
MSPTWHVGVDIGGTFTDIVAVDTDSARVEHLKVPSSRSNPSEGVLDGLRALRDEMQVQPETIRLLLHGTTLVTNAIIERRLAKTALVTTEGFRDVLEIGRHWRKELYDPFLEQEQPLIPRELRLEVRERLAADGTEVLPLDADSSAQVLEALAAADVECVAVAFLHSYRNSTHEAEMAERLRAADGWYVCASTELLREIREYERTATTVLNAALMPLVDAYLEDLERGLEQERCHASLFVTQSNGGALTPQRARTRPVNLALSGPVGGVVAAGDVARAAAIRDVIAFDMGGTSTDVSIISEGNARFTSEMTVGDVPVRIPTIQVHSIGAGGGSIAQVVAGGALRVGPESAGSDPGPACYGGGGTKPTVTDCQLVLGRLGDVRLANRLQLSAERAREAIDREVASKLGITVEEAAAGVVEVANAAMERAVRVALRDRGDDPRDFSLVVFGGAGPLHGAELAQRLSIRRVVVPPHPGTLSAFGFLATDVRMDYAASELQPAESDRAGEVRRIFERLEGQAREDVASDGELDVDRLTLRRSIDMRYVGQAYEVAVPLAQGQITEETLPMLQTEFQDLHRRAYGFANEDAACEMVTFRVSAHVELDKSSIDGQANPGAPASPSPAVERDVYVAGSGFTATKFLARSELPAGSRIAGPAVITQSDATTFLPPFATGVIDERRNLVLDIALPEEVKL